MNENQVKLMEEIGVMDVITREYYKVICLIGVEALSEKAALLSIGGRMEIITEWFPKSQLACDSEGNLYVAHWLYKKKMGG